MRMTINSIIYFYIFICVTLLFFNVFYIFRSKGRNRSQTRRERYWERMLLDEFQRLTQTAYKDRAYQELLERKLKSTEELMAFNEVLSRWREGRKREITDYFVAYRGIFRNLALEYGKKAAMERAFFAYVIASYHPPIGAAHHPLVEILLGYMENSTVYCRENVLCALYALGSEQAVEHAFELLNTRGWYHHPRLLSDGLAKFAGDRAGLVGRLWRNRKKWSDFLVVAVVQFATGLSDDGFSEAFLRALGQESLPLEVRFALIRYFQRHYFPAAKPVLLKFLQEGGGAENDLAITAASSLAKYPGTDTRQALKNALHSRNWYVRRNAASSLVALGISREETDEIRRSGDRYALEILEYTAGFEEPAQKTPTESQEKAVATV